jgi:hypothetical protein
MPTNRTFDDFIKPGFVSVWVGDFRSEDDFDDYLLDHFATEFGFEVRPQSVREMGVEPCLLRLQSSCGASLVRKLLTQRWLMQRERMASQPREVHWRRSFPWV